MPGTIKYIILAMLITILMLYLIYPTPLVVIKYPNFEESVSDKYIDDKGRIYRYFRREIK